LTKMLHAFLIPPSNKLEYQFQALLHKGGKFFTRWVFTQPVIENIHHFSVKHCYP
jgi:hypothetical protein